MNNPYYIQPANVLPGLEKAFEGLRSGAEAKLERAKQQEDFAQRKEGVKILQSGDINAIQAFLIENPDIGVDIDKAYQFKNEITEQNAINTAWDVYTDKKPAAQALIDRADVVLEEGGDISETLTLAEKAQQDPSTIKAEAALLLMRKDPKAFDLYQKSKGERAPQATPTDIDDYVADADAEALRVSGKGLTPGNRNKARLEFKRAQASEVRQNRLAEKNVDMTTAQAIAFNTKRGTRLAEISTAAKLISAKGERTPVQKIETAKGRMKGNLAQLAKYYNDLDTLGAIINTDSNTFENLTAALSSSTAGQAFGRVIGTKAQSIRASIKALKPLLLQDIRQSTDMGARGLDSEKELEFYLKAATDEKVDLRSNLAAISVLDRAFGTGEVANELEGIIDSVAFGTIKAEGGAIREGGLARAKAEEYLRQNPQHKEAFREKYGYVPEGIN